MIFLKNSKRFLGFLNIQYYYKMSKRSKTANNGENNAKKIKTNFWSLGLLKAIEDPALVIKTDDLVSIILDQFPKAEFHYLIISRKDIPSLKEVKYENLDLIIHMKNVAQELVNEPKHKNKTFKLGFHSQPSMHRLHLHVISDDMNSVRLTTKKHWNSFTTDFFIPIENVIDSLKENKKVILLSEEKCKELISSPLKCHKCNYKPKNMPDLKKHILEHL